MKTLNAKKYKYVGTSQNTWHVFMSIWDDFDPEMLYVTRARYLLPDGSSVYFDPIKGDDSGLTLEGKLRLSQFEMDAPEYCVI
jgi:hypothetical protein